MGLSERGFCIIICTYRYPVYIRNDLEECLNSLVVSSQFELAVYSEWAVLGLYGMLWFKLESFVVWQMAKDVGMVWKCCGVIHI